MGGREGGRDKGPRGAAAHYFCSFSTLCSEIHAVVCMRKTHPSGNKSTLLQQLQHLNLHQLPFLGSEIKHGLAHLKWHILHIQPEQDILSCLFIYFI